MNIEQLSFSAITQASNSTLLAFIQKSLETLETRFKRDSSSEEEKEAIISGIMLIHSQSFRFVTKVEKKSLTPEKYTPFRGNLLEIGLALREFEEYEEDEELIEACESFARKFFIACCCQKGCHRRMRFSNCLDVFRDIYQLNKKIKAHQVGGVLKNIVLDKGATGRQVYSWSFENVKICKDFFRFVYNITPKTLRRLQNCIKENKPFDYK